MNDLSIINQIGKKCTSTVCVFYSNVNYNNEWLKEFFEKHKISTVYIDNIFLLRKMIVTLGETNISIVAINIGSLSGKSAFDFIHKEVKKIRAILPNCGIVLISKNENQMRHNLLPENTWIISKETDRFSLDKILNSISSQKEDKYVNARNWFVNSSIDIKKIRKLKPIFKNTCPNFNIKHPSILIPITLAAIKMNRPVCFEISPQEALVYYDSVGDNCKDRVKNVLQQVRDDVDFVKESLNADIYLHLDHCDDPDIIVHAVNIGFDSIMADGSKQGLESNIKFVNNAINYAKKFNVLIEGEVGSIDTYGRKQLSKTSIKEFEEFSNSTKADFIGINIGQIHGSDYGFDRARISHREILDIKEKHDSIDLESLYLACNEIQDEMRDLLIEEETSIIDHLKYKILSNHVFTTLEDFLSDFNKKSFYDEYILSKIILNWNIKRTESSENIMNKYKEVLGINFKSNVKSTDKRFLDFELLYDINQSLLSSSSKLVLHGGSSIYTEDLRLIKGLNIARINFGSEVFNMYLKTLFHEHHYPSKKENINNVLFAKNYLKKYLGNWKDWIQNQPGWMNSFIEELITRYFEPLY